MPHAPTIFAGVSETNLLGTAIDAAKAGAERLMEGLLRPPEIHQKSARSNIVTWADEAAHESIVALLLGRHPSHAILGEEGCAGDPDGPYTWIVDPLDGTSNYARGMSPWGVSIAVRETGGPLLAGVIFDPLRDEMFAVERGGGTACRPSDTATIGGALIATGLQNDDPEAIHQHALRVEQMHLQCRGTRAIGCPSFALAYVAAGKLDGFVEKDATYAWDVAAAVLLLEEAGGVATDFDGGPVNLGPGITNIVAANKQIHADLLDVVNLRRT
ncbi:MAG: monophosphatase [Ilumatobacteraceae bacterium]|nr:monophosphatase [Ilumatobacteraceae bacterium]